MIHANGWKRGKPADQPEESHKNTLTKQVLHRLYTFTRKGEAYYHLP